MDITEARKIARIIGTADSACSNCVNALVEQFNDTFKEFNFEIVGEATEYFNIDGESLGENVNVDTQDYSYSERYLVIKVMQLSRI